jgi:hypothetical protein
MECKGNIWKNIYNNTIFKPHNNHLLNNIDGYYLYLNSTPYPMILSKILPDLINEINYHLYEGSKSVLVINHIFYKNNNTNIYNKRKIL